MDSPAVISGPVSPDDYPPTKRGQLTEPDPLASPTPPGAVVLDELRVAGDQDARVLLDDLFAELGLPTGRLVLRPGLYAVAVGEDGREHLVVDYLVPGTRTLEPRTGGGGRGWDVKLNYEAGRCPPEHPSATGIAIDRYIVPLDAARRPDWLVPVE